MRYREIFKGVWKSCFSIYLLTNAKGESYGEKCVHEVIWNNFFLSTEFPGDEY